MSPRRKREIIRPEVRTEPVTYQYQCPTCKTKVARTFSMITPASASVKITTSFWCKNTRCNATHRITYRLFKKRSGEPKMKVFDFTSNGEKYIKRFKLLEPTTKGEKEHE